MIILSAQKLTVAFGEEVLFSDVSFDVNEGDRVGFIGVNGTGKTTLFKIINGAFAQESGTVSISAGLRIGYMEQHVIRGGEATVYNEALSIFSPLLAAERELEEIHREIDGGNHSDELLTRQMTLNEEYERSGGLTFRARTRSALMGLGFPEEDLEKPVSVLSGGERSKVQLVKLLLSGSALLLLDEPTNHLDIEAVEWLERFLLEYRGSFIVISHDRYFLDKVTNRTIELENGHLGTYKGGYSVYMEKKRAEREAAEKHYRETLGEIKRIEGIIEQQKRWNQEHNYVTIASKQKSIDKLKETLVKPDDGPEALHFNFKPKDGSGNDVLETENLSLAVGGDVLFRNVHLDIKRGERVFLLGSNGSGKTSLFRILTGEYEPTFGKVRFGSRVEVGYFDQLQGGLDAAKTVMDEVWDAFPKMLPGEVRGALGRFLFRGEEVFKNVGKLSGGERARVALLKLMLGGANLLLLDEPTNHLDITSREALENALIEYGGTMLIVSHDRYLINKLADRVYVLSRDGVTEYKGGYDDYLSRALHSTEEAPSASAKKEEKPNEYRLQKQRESDRRKAETRVKRAEERIAAIEREAAALSEQLTAPEIAADYQRITDLTAEIAEKNAELDAAMDEWAEASERLEELLAE